MKDRLIEFIGYATGGKFSEFAEKMGWTPQYLHRLTSSGSIGLRPIIALLEHYPELNARWLILGEGVMLASGSEAVKKRLLKILQLERYMPVMSGEELAEFANGRDEYDNATIERWTLMLDKRNADKEQRFRSAMERSQIR